jgi:hypothetical protein
VESGVVCVEEEGDVLCKAEEEVLDAGEEDRGDDGGLVELKYGELKEFDGLLISDCIDKLYLL